MKEWDEEELERFIRENKDKFDIYRPRPGHQEYFLNKLIKKFKEVISIVPYLVKVGIVTLLIFIFSFFVWKIYICPPLTKISFKYWKAEHDYRRQINKSIRLTYDYINGTAEEVKFEQKLHEFDDNYEILAKQLKEDPSLNNITNMLQFYQEKLLTIQDYYQNYTNSMDN